MSFKVSFQRIYLFTYTYAICWAIAAAFIFVFYFSTIKTLLSGTNSDHSPHFGHDDIRRASHSSHSHSGNHVTGSRIAELTRMATISEKQRSDNLEQKSLPAYVGSAISAAIINTTLITQRYPKMIIFTSLVSQPCEIFSNLERIPWRCFKDTA